MNDFNTQEYNLPPIRKDCKLKLNHFPTYVHAFIFRAWEMIPVRKLAEVLNTSLENVQKIAEDMGLPPQKNTQEWISKGYITIIRSMWHILPYEQIIELLDWDYNKLSYVLKEDDFLGIKLGNFKPYCETVVYKKLNEYEANETLKIKEYMNHYVRIYDSEDIAKPFDFFSNKNIGMSHSSNLNYNLILNDKWSIVNNTGLSQLEYYIDLFIEEYSLLYHVNLTRSKSMNSNSIVLEISNELESESHRVEIKSDCIKIIGSDYEGILRGISLLGNLAKTNGGPFYNIKAYHRKPRFHSRIIYSYCGLYGNVFDVDNSVSYPDRLLYEYSKIGINGIWAQGILYQLTEFPFEPSLSYGWQKRLYYLKSLVNKAKKYGIKVYLYINEPRNMPLSFFEKNPDLKGHIHENCACMCTSSPQVLSYIKDAITTICEFVPELGGFFTITRSENITNCYSHTNESSINCPRCKKRAIEDVISQLNNTISNAASAVDANIKTFAWTWGGADMKTDHPWIEKCIEKMSSKITVMCTSEENMEYEVAGLKDYVKDYTLSLIPPSLQSKEFWAHSKKTNHNIAAKVQLNNTWECSTVPFIPIYQTIIQYMNNLIKLNVNDILLSWTLGGYPSKNIEIASFFFFEEISSDSIEGHDVFKELYGEYAEVVKKATDQFCEAFKEFPFHIDTLYFGPQNAGVSNLIYEEPSGFKSTMTCFAYDDLEKWRSIYPVEIFENQFKLLSEKWKKGLDILNEMPECELKDISKVCYAIFKSSYNQICFIRARDEYAKMKTEKTKILILSILQSELDLAIAVYRRMIKNSTIGYEAANHYYYNRSMIMEKIVCCKYLINKYRN